MALGSRAEECEWMRIAIASIERAALDRGIVPAEAMINRVVEVDEDGVATDFEYRER
jgi:hypothetical protein